MVIVPAHLKGMAVYPAFGKIVMDEKMSKKECLEAQKIYPSIKWVEPIETKRKRK